MKLLDYFQRFRNADGLLEKLESWVFVEWSKANDFVQDVNHPSNMLYAEVLAGMDRLFLYRDVLGLASLDSVNRTVHLRFTDLRLDRGEGSRPTPDGKVELRWRKDGDKLRYQVGVPCGYAVRVDNRSTLQLVKEP